MLRHLARNRAWGGDFPHRTSCKTAAWRSSWDWFKAQTSRAGVCGGGGLTAQFQGPLAFPGMNCLYFVL